MSDALERLTAALADRYRIERELGAGGMATVYLAQDLRHDRKVALKVLRPELAALHVQHMNDPVVLAAVNDIETLCSGLSNKIWQKITLLNQFRDAAHGGLPRGEAEPA
jgi:serine/threonine protein kinase